jgi:hypothetical protein
MHPSRKTNRNKPHAQPLLSAQKHRQTQHKIPANWKIPEVHRLAKESPGWITKEYGTVKTFWSVEWVFCGETEYEDTGIAFDCEDEDVL